MQGRSAPNVCEEDVRLRIPSFPRPTMSLFMVSQVMRKVQQLPTLSKELSTSRIQAFPEPLDKIRIAPRSVDGWGVPNYYIIELGKYSRACDNRRVIYPLLPSLAQAWPVGPLRIRLEHGPRRRFRQGIAQGALRYTNCRSGQKVRKLRIFNFLWTVYSLGPPRGLSLSIIHIDKARCTVKSIQQAPDQQIMEYPLKTSAGPFASWWDE